MRFILSRNAKAPEDGPHGLTLDDVRGSIRKPVSYWAIDESGNPSRKPGENGKAFTLSAVTELSPIDYGRLLRGVPLYNGEVHFSRLRNEHPDICIRLMTDLGRENILIVSKTVTKRSKTVSKPGRKGPPVDELYLFSLLNELVGIISEIDLSDTVIVTYDRNNNIRGGTCPLLWSDRRIVVLGDSEEYRLLQIADLTSSSIGKMLLPMGFADPRYFEKIRARTVEIRDDVDGMVQVGDTQSPTSAPEEWENGDRPQLSLTFLPYAGRGCGYITPSSEKTGAGELTQRPPSAPVGKVRGGSHKDVSDRPPERGRGRNGRDRSDNRKGRRAPCS